MSMMGWPRLGLAVAAFILQTALLYAALPSGPEEAPAEASLAGQFLVAAPEMGDPRFERTVVLITQHDKTGALGIVVNRPLGEETLAHLLETVGEKDVSVAGSVPIFYGGPVQPEAVFVVHSADYSRPETTEINDRLSLTSSVHILRDIAAKSGPAKILVAFGYAGWGPGQLERELQLGAWATAEADPNLVFDADRDSLWDNVWGRRTKRL
jgi:putative transcriptional regulator